MDPNSTQTPGKSLPEPSVGQNTSAVLAGGPGSGGAGDAAGLVASAQAVPPAASSVRLADDSASEQEMDQEWVNRAKDIVERTKADPFTQSNELNRIKAEYLKVRFGKELNDGDQSSQ